MSLGNRMTFQEAYDLAEEAAEQLRPTVAHLKAVGSLRRKRDAIGDIEFLARPHVENDIFGEGAPALLHEVRAAMHNLGTWVQGGDRAMRITDLLGREGARLELYLVHPPAAWGSMLAIRTGPEDLGRYCVTRMRAKGFRHVNGHAQVIGTEVIAPTATEEDFFELAGVACLPPRLRDDQSAGLWKAYNARSER